MNPLLSEERKKELESIFFDGGEEDGAPVDLTEEEHEYWAKLHNQYLEAYLNLLSRNMQADAAANRDK